MGYNFNAAFSQLNTNTEGRSANILDNDEVNTAKGNYKACALEGETTQQTLSRLGITGRAAQIVLKANPKAATNGHFRTDTNDVYIPKEAIALMKENGTFDENALMGVTKKPDMGV